MSVCFGIEAKAFPIGYMYTTKKNKSLIFIDYNLYLH